MATKTKDTKVAKEVSPPRYNYLAPTLDLLPSHSTRWKEKKWDQHRYAAWFFVATDSASHTPLCVRSHMVLVSPVPYNCLAPTLDFLPSHSTRWKKKKWDQHIYAAWFFVATDSASCTPLFVWRQMVLVCPLSHIMSMLI
jgi:hypothetical protein